MSVLKDATVVFSLLLRGWIVYGFIRLAVAFVLSVRCDRRRRREVVKRTLDGYADDATDY